MATKAADRTTPTVPRLEPEFFERLFEGAGLPLFVCDLDGQISACNSLGRQLLRSPRGGRPLRDLLPEASRERFAESFETVRRTSEPTEFRMSVPGLDGEMDEYATWLTPVFDADNRLEAIAVWFHNITARMQLRRSMRQRERLTALGTLSGSVAHHYNNLLCCIATSLEYAMNMNTVAAMRRALRRTANATSRANELTQQLLAFAQADYRAADMADLTETILFYFDENDARIRRAGVDLRVDWQPLPTVPVPREQMLIVVDHLVNNALEAMPQGGTLTVALRRRDDNHVSLTITDTGPGIRPEHLEHLFEPFFTTKGELASGGTHQPGMGLAVAHGLISEMHGSITAANVTPIGSKFEITLPLHFPNAAPRAKVNNAR